MATIAFSLAGQAVGGLLGGPLGAMAGRALGALGGAAVDQALFGERPAPAAPPQFRLQGSAEGGAIPRVYGWARVSGNVIWATELEELDETLAGAKGLFGRHDDDGPVLAANFAVALSEGEVHWLGRIWADGRPLETEGLTIRFHRGSEDQGVDSLIEAKQGTGAAPAYRGLCYLVFERLPVARFGNRIPVISAEICRVVGDLEPQITAVTLIPGATEFGYDPEPRVRVLGAGATANENTHLSAGLSDWTCSLDELQALCPNLRHVALVVAWFGDDLRCGHCTIRPKVESAARTIEGTAWSVAGLGRGTAEVVSTHDGGPAYGGTPSDAAVRAAIADLAARGIAVTLYPLVMMDIPAGNALPDPYGGTSQPAYPWRGRITCDPAPAVAGSPDRTADVTAQVAAFVGGADGWGYRRMLRHYAQLAADAGGVDAFVLGSEMRGMSFLRDGDGGFPFVAALKELAEEVRAIVGEGTRLTYGADWSEFAGLQPPEAPGDKYFHLDALWASPHIDAVGIDNYMPLADWRDGEGHADAATTPSPYLAGYLQSGIAGGEGYDWYYASDADRLAGERRPILDGAHGEPWIWRYKDLVNWWANAHHDRMDGVRQAEATAWVPQGKPIWFTELGCAAIDKGPNQPNVFGDPKSAESGVPHFSSGAADGLAQRQFLRAQLGWWSPDAEGFEDARNPVSGVYGGRMLDPERLYLWTWDARPYPAFPAQAETWRDAANHPAGHWLTGRLGAAASDELARAIAADYGAVLAGAEPAPPLVHGLCLEAVVSGREALQGLSEACGLTVRETDAGLVLARPDRRSSLAVTADGLVAADGPLTARRRPDPGDAIGSLALSFVNRERDYLPGTATAAAPSPGAALADASPLVLDPAGARTAAERALAARIAAAETLELTLPPSQAALEAGDLIAVAGQGQGPFEITEIRDGLARRISARPVPAPTAPAVVATPPPAMAAPRPRALPLVMAAHLPPTPEAPTVSRLAVAAFADPWPGEVPIADDATGAVLLRLARPGHVGWLTEPLAAGPTTRWDVRNTIAVTLASGHLGARDDDVVATGANRIAVETDSGAWEIVGFAEATLTGPGTYALGRLLRGQGGTDHAVGQAAAGNRVIVLDECVGFAAVPAGWLGETPLLRAFAGRTDAEGAALTPALDAAPALPLAPGHLRARRDPASGDIAFSWIRRSRADADGWGISDAPLDVVPEAYRLTVFDGGVAVRTIDTAAPTATYAAAAQTADFDGLPGAFTFTVAQLSPALGAGHPATGAFHG